MNINNLVLTIALIFCIFFKLAAQKQRDYMTYHQDIVSAEELIINEKYTDALLIFEKVFDSYEYVFLRDYKIAAQLALYIKDEAGAFYLDGTLWVNGKINVVKKR